MRRLFKLLPTLRAEEALRQAAIVSVGTGSHKSDSDVEADWRRDAYAGRVLRPRSRDEIAAFAAASGLRVLRE